MVIKRAHSNTISVITTAIITAVITITATYKTANNIINPTYIKEEHTVEKDETKCLKSMKKNSRKYTKMKKIHE